MTLMTHNKPVTWLSGFVVLLLTFQAQLYAEDWMPPEDEWDWLKTASNEWIKGELIALYDENVEFDSDEFGVVEIDWEDVAILRTAGQKSIRLSTDEIVKGKLLIKGDKVIVVDTGRQIDRPLLLSIAPGDQGESNYWDGEIGLSLDRRSGNSDLETLSVNAEANRRTSTTRVQINYRGIQTDTNNVETENNHRFTTSMDWFFSHRTFFRPVNFEYYRDPFQNIAHRYTYSAQIGYHLIDNSKMGWDVSIGPGYQHTEFDDVPADEEKSDSTDVIQAGTQFDWDITKDIEYDLLYNVMKVSDSAGEYIHHFETGFEFDLTGSIELTARYIIDRIEKPTQNADGSFPEKDDERLLFGLSYEF